MYLGTSKTVITPIEPVELAGFSHRKGKVSEVFDQLYLKAYLLQSDHNLFLLLVADLIWWDTHYVKNVKEEIAERFNIPRDQVVFHATHNHSGPQTSDRFSRELGEPSTAYLTYLKEQVINSIEVAFSNLEKVDVIVNKGSTDLGVYRRNMVDGKIEMAPNRERAVDNDLTVYSFIRNNEKKAIWIHYTCHPTTTDSRIISSEYTGICCKKIEDRFTDCTVAFLQGFCGDIRPALVRGDDFYRGSTEDMSRIGEELSNKVIDLLYLEGDVCGFEDFTFRQLEIPLTFSNKAIEMNIPESLKEEWPKLVKRNNGSYDLIINFIKLNEKLALLCCNAELVQDFGKYIKKVNKNILPLGYSNGMVGYIPTSQQLEEGGYEAEESIFYFGYPAKLSSSLQYDIEQNIDLLLRGDI